MTNTNDPGRQEHDGIPFTATPPAQPERPKPALGTGAILGIVGGSLAALIAVVLVVAFLVVPKGSSATGTGSTAARAADPADAARKFMSALAKSDAKTALAYVDLVPSTKYLTDEMLAASHKAAPLTKVTVGTVVEKSTFDAEVPVSYRLGDDSFSATLKVFRTSDKGWRVQNPTIQLYVDPFEPLGLTLNGVAVTGTSVRVFPGTYELALTNENFAIEGESTVVAELGETPSMYDTRPVLSEAGLATFRDLVKKDVDACLASPNLDPGCGIRAAAGQDSDGTSLVEGSLSRTLNAAGLAKLSTLEARPSASNPLIVQGDRIGGLIETKGQCTQDGRQFPCELMFGGTGLGTPTIDFSSETPVLRR